MVKNLLSSAVLWWLATAGYAQNHICGQSEITNQLFLNHPELKAGFDAAQKSIQPVLKKDKSTAGVTAGIDYMVPVVFHVLHQGGTENISDAQITDQIRILNRDYQRQNADTDLVVAPFNDNIAHVGFGFQLAKIDPDGNCTNGIVRHYTSKTNWDVNNFADFIYSWPRHKYLNIYVVKTLNINATAYAFLPGTPVSADADVIVTMHNMVGSIGTGTVANSRVLTHEVGHWFGLQHIWGTSNQPGVICGDDLVEDTPETKGFSTCATGNTGICNPGTPENVQNYMDYSPCKIMFTNGQASRMLGVMTGSLNGRYNVSSAANLAATGLGDAPIVCTPFVDFKSSRKQNCVERPFTFTSLEYCGAQAGTRVWTFVGGTPETSTDSIVNVTYSAPGTYTVKLTVTNSFGPTTENRVDYIVVENETAGSTLPYSVDFETNTAVENLRLVNFDVNSNSWIRSTNAGANGTGSSYTLNSFNDVYEIKGEKDAFELPYLDLTAVENPAISYAYAYARTTAAQRDSFKVQYSLDCGENWSTFSGLPTTFQMAQASGGITQEDFVPSADHWANHIISGTQTTPIGNRNGVKIRFLFVKDINKTTANNIFVDQISLTGTTEIAGMAEKETIQIFPNPTDGRFSVRLGRLSKPGPLTQLFDVRGRSVPYMVGKPENGELVINPTETLPKGLYTLMLDVNGSLLPQKLVVN